MDVTVLGVVTSDLLVIHFIHENFVGVCSVVTFQSELFGIVDDGSDEDDDVVVVVRVLVVVDDTRVVVVCLKAYLADDSSTELST